MYVHMCACAFACVKTPMMTPSSTLHRPPSTPVARHHPAGTPLHHAPSTPLLPPPHHTPLTQFPATPRQQPWTPAAAVTPADVASSPGRAQWRAPQATPTQTSSATTQHKTSAEWALMAQQWASRRQPPTTPRQTPNASRQSPYHGTGGGDATPLVDET